jgi:glycosyltransferase involved in cell wall biosynthesis
MKISLIVAVYNGGELLRKNLKSISNLKISPNTEFETLVIDNNSVDDTSYIIKEYVKKYPERFRYIYEQKPGRSNALNTGINASKGEIIAFTDHDIILPDDWLIHIKEGFERFHCAGICGKVLPLWEKTPPIWLKEMQGVLAINLSMKIEKQVEMVGCNSAIKRECFIKYGGFRPDLGVRPGLHIGGEDTEFSYRILKNGEKTVYFPDMLVYHQIPANRMCKKYCLRVSILYSFSLMRVQEVNGLNMDRLNTKILKEIVALPKNFIKLLLTPISFLHLKSAYKYRNRVLLSVFYCIYKCLGWERTLKIVKLFLNWRSLFLYQTIRRSNEKSGC